MKIKIFYDTIKHIKLSDNSKRGVRSLQKYTADNIISLLELKPLEREGGMYRETYRCKDRLNGRSCGSAIYFLMTRNAFSHLHRMETDEIYHFYMGDPLELMEITSHGDVKIHLLGTDLAAGQRPQVVIPGGSWQGSHLAKGGDWVLFSTTMSPAFIPEDYENADVEKMKKKHPEHAALIDALTGEIKYR